MLPLHKVLKRVEFSIGFLPPVAECVQQPLNNPAVLKQFILQRIFDKIDGQPVDRPAA